jgi:lysophospholipase L1-like esterase
LFGVILLVQGLLFEAGMRWYGGSEAAPVFQQLFMQDGQIGHIPRPGARIHYATSEFATDIAINSSGVRGNEIGPRLPHERRIVVLGDSLVLAVQVELQDTFCGVLERRLNQRADGLTYRVINAGVQGYGPVEEWLFFDKVIARLQPDVVLVAVFVANDAVEALDSARKLDIDRHVAARARDEATDWARRVVRRSMVLQTARMRYDALKARLDAAPVTQRPLMTYLDAPPRELDRGFEVSRQAIASIRDRAARIGARTGLVLVPARFQLEDEDYGRLAATVASNGGTMVRDAATDRFARALAPLGLPTLDLLPVLRQQPDPATLFFRENVHFTVRGHRVVGQALEQFLEGSGLLTGHTQASSLAAPLSRPQ